MEYGHEFNHPVETRLNLGQIVEFVIDPHDSLEIESHTVGTDFKHTADARHLRLRQKCLTEEVG